MAINNWQIKKIKEIASFNELNVDRFKFKEIEYIDTASVREGRVIEKKIMKFENSPSRAKRILRNNDIIISTVRPNLKHYAFVKDVRENTICSTGFVVITPKEADPKFLYYYLTQDSFIKFLTQIAEAHTSAYPAFNPDIIENSKILLPEINEQKDIGDVLYSIDKKIELNNVINNYLEQISQALFKHWFIDFEFPDEQGRPYKSSGGKMVGSELGLIPINWSVGFLGDSNLTKFIKSGIHKFSGEKIYLATADVDNNNIINMETKITFNNRPSRANMQPIINSVWFAKMRNSKKVLFFDNYHKFELENIILSTGFSGLKVHPHALYFIWCFISNNNFEITKDNYCIGTTMQAINNENIKKIKHIIPGNDVLIKFNELIKILYKKINNNNLENITLSHIRDTLLPKLITGKIRVNLEDISEG